MANFKTLVFSFICIFFMLSTWAQERSIDTMSVDFWGEERKEGWWTLGIDAGLGYLTSDVDPDVFKGFGVGLNFGRNMFYKPDQLIITNIRFRVQYAVAKGLGTEPFEGILHNQALNGNRPEVEGLNYVSSPGYIFENYRSSMLESALEVPLVLNPVKMNNRLHLALFGGLGIGWYHADINQLDANGQKYDYAGSAFNFDGQNERDIRSMLYNQWDDEYETSADGFEDEFLKTTLIPAAGIEVGIHAQNNITIGLSHRVSFARTDLLDGAQWNDNNELTGDDDMLHYSSFFIKWVLENKVRNSIPPEIIPVTPVTEVVNTTGDIAVIRAKLNNVKSVKDISISHNGINYNILQYYRKELATNVPLIEGRNEIIITVSNNEGTDQKRYIFNYIPGNFNFDKNLRPKIEFIKPSIEGQTILKPIFNAEIAVRGVKSAKDIRLFVNNNEIKDFEFYTDDIILRSPIAFNPGNNEIKLVALNNQGVSQKSLKVQLDSTGAAYSIDLISPEQKEFQTGARQIVLEALISGLKSADELMIKLNNEVINVPFDLEDPTISETLALEIGTNILEIKVGQSNDMVVEKLRILRTASKEDVQNKKTELTPSLDNEFLISEFFDPIWDANQKNCIYNLEIKYPPTTLAKDVDIFLNNQRIDNLTRFEDERIIRAAVNLTEGTNYVKIRDNKGAVPIQDKILFCEATGQKQASNYPDAQQEQKEITDQPSTQVVPEQKERVEAAVPLPQKPRITSIQPSEIRSSTNDPTVTFQAEIEHVDSRDDITIYFNDQVVTDFNFDKKSGKLIVVRNTIKEKNQFTIIAINDQGVTDAIRYIEYQKIDPPSVSILNPGNQQNFDSPLATIKSLIKGAKNENIQIFVNGTEQKDWERSGEVLEGQVKLMPGVNKIVVKAGNETASKSKTVYVNYTEIKAPIIVLINPEKDERVINKELPLLANIKNLKEKSGIQLRLNGQTVTEYSFTNETLQAQLNLNQGSNVIDLMAKNQAGEDVQTLNIQYHIPKPPSIGLSSPSSENINTKTNPYPVNLRLKHIYQRADIVLKLNGVQLEAFDFNAEDGMLRVPLELKEGINEFVVEIENEDGGDARSFILNYTVPKPPVIHMLSPDENEVTKIERIGLEANILFVNSKENIQLFLNGVKTAFTFNESTLKSRLTLVDGLNEIRIEAINGDGKEIENTRILFDRPLPPPVIELRTPRESGLVVEEEIFELLAKVSHVENQEDINFSLNSIETPFSYDPSSEFLRAKISLKPGINEFNIEVENESGLAKSKTTINFEKPVDLSDKLPKISLININEAKLNPYDTSKGMTSIALELSNITSRDQILLLVNGVPVTNFVFNESSKKLISSIDLIKGSNSIKIKASNEFGTDEFSKTVFF